MPNAPLIRLALGQVLTESNNPSHFERAISHLSTVIEQDSNMPGAWRLLATAYGKNQNMPMADYAMAEFYLLTGNTQEAVKLAKRAIDKIKNATPAYRHLMDILELTNSKDPHKL